MNPKLKAVFAENKRKLKKGGNVIITQEDLLLKKFDKNDKELISDMINMKLPLTADKEEEEKEEIEYPFLRG